MHDFIEMRAQDSIVTEETLLVKRLIYSNCMPLSGKD